MIEKTKDTILEKPILLRIGFMLFILRPLTFAQLWEIGSKVSKMEDLSLEDKFNPYSKAFERFNDIKTCEDVVVTMLFRGKIKRLLFGWYVKKHLTANTYKQIIEGGLRTFDAAFFLTSLTFLRGIREMTKRTNTAEATALGGSWEEL